MSFKNQSVFSSVFTNTTFTITEEMQISEVSIEVVSGTATLLGGLQIPGLVNIPVSLDYNQPVVLKANKGFTLSDITVDSTAGGVFEIIGIYGYNDALDPAAVAYFAATGITGIREQQAINNLITSLRNNGLWSKMKAVYPFVTDNRNLLSYTEDFGNAVWSVGNLTRNSNTTNAPNGTNTADTISDNLTNSSHVIYQNALPATTGLMTASVYLKNNTRRYAVVSICTGSSNQIRYSAVVDLQIGAITQNNSLNSPTNTASSIQDAGNGWYRISVSLNCTTTSALSNYIVVALSNTSTPSTFDTSTLDPKYSGDGSSIYLWGAQLELGSPESTYQAITTTPQAYISNQFKYNLVNPVDSDAAFRLVFNGGWTFSRNGATPNGTNGFAETYYSPSVNSTITDNHFMMYLPSVTLPASNTTDLGAFTADYNSRFALSYFQNPSFDTTNFDVRKRTTVSNSLIGSGFVLYSRSATNLAKVYFNNSNVVTDTSTTSSYLYPNITVYLGALHLGTTASAFSNRLNSFTSIGDAVTETEAANLYTAIQNYQTALGRQV